MTDLEKLAHAIYLHLTRLGMDNAEAQELATATAQRMDQTARMRAHFAQQAVA